MTPSHRHTEGSQIGAAGPPQGMTTQMVLCGFDHGLEAVAAYMEDLRKPGHLQLQCSGQGEQTPKNGGWHIQYRKKLARRTCSEEHGPWAGHSEKTKCPIWQMRGF